MICFRRSLVYGKAFMLARIIEEEGADNIPEDILSSLLIQGWDILVIN